MLQLPPLIHDLGLILTAAGVVTLLFKRVGQPLVLGYIIAGILVGPHVGLFPTIIDTKNIQVWADIGVIFLLFGLGLEFSFKKLSRVGGSAALTAGIEVTAMAGVGFLTGRALGWSAMDSVFLGGILSISSTTIIIRSLEEAGVKGRGFVNLVFGVLIVEDLIAILLLVLLSTISISQSEIGTELLSAMLKLLFFLVFWFLSGIFLLPTILHRVRTHLSGETLLIASMGMCFLLVIVSTRLGFSPALGAFVMGSLLGGTRDGKRIEHLIDPVKKLFAAIFFVSVGMLINPPMLVEYSGPILILTIVTLLGKSVSSTLGAIFSGGSLRHAVQTGLSLAQIGEFSFVIAALGATLKVTSDFLYPVAVGVSALTTFLSPYLIRHADQVYGFIDVRIPLAWKEVLQDYSVSIRRTSGKSGWRAIGRTYSLRLLTSVVVSAAIFLLVSRVALPFLRNHVENAKLLHGIGLGVSVVLSAPFFWAIVMGRFEESDHLKVFQNPAQRPQLVIFELFRWFVAIFVFSILSTQFITWEVAAGVSFLACFCFLIFFSRRLGSFYSVLEKRFVKNLDFRGLPKIAPWDAHLVSLDIHPSTSLVGQTLGRLKVRENYGVTITLIERGGRKIVVPNREEMLFPYDRVYVIGTDEQISKFSLELEGQSFENANLEEVNFVLRSHLVPEDSLYSGCTIRESGIREKSQGLVVGLERGEKRILNPDSAMIIESGDLLWIVGENSALKSL